jgi:RHS repeat-associated protein
VGSSISLAQREFTDNVVDLRVKVPGGTISISRNFYDNAWHLHPIASHLKGVYEESRAAVSRGFVIRSSGFSRGVKKRTVRGPGGAAYFPPPLVLVGIEKEGIIYRFSGFIGEQKMLFVKDGAKIVEVENGWIWQNPAGQWAEYDLAGYLLAFGNRRGTLGKLLYQDNDFGKPVIGVADRNDQQVIWADGVTAVHDGSNRRVAYHYNSDGALTKVVDVLGQETLYDYELKKLNPRPGEHYRYLEVLSTLRGRQRNGGAAPRDSIKFEKPFLISKREPSGRVTQIQYDDSNYPHIVTDASGNDFVFKYDYNSVQEEYYRSVTTPSKMVKEVWSNKDGETTRVDINGRTVKTLEHNKEERTLTITDEKGNLTEKRFDEWDNMLEVIYPDNTTESYSYEYNFHQPIRFKDRRGYVTTYEYDEHGNLLKKTEAVATPAERVTTFTYDDQHQLVSMTLHSDANTEDTTTTWTYDSNGNVISITDPLGYTTQFLQYDILGNPLEIRDNRGFIWRYSYDALGRKLSETNPLNQTTTYEYDSANNQTAIVDVAQNRSEFVYNSHNRLIKTIAPDGHEKLTVYNSDQLPIQVIDEEGKSRFTEYDNEGRLVRSIDGAGNEIVRHYDDTLASEASSDLPVRIEYPTYNQRRYYDKLQRLVRTTDIIGDETKNYSVSYQYDAANNTLSQTDKEGKTTVFEYDALGRLLKVTDAKGGVTQLAYDVRDNLIAVHDPKDGVTRYQYDQNDNRVKVIRPMGQATQYEYDAAGNKTVQLDANGQKVVYQYNAISSLTQIDYYAASDHNTPVKTVSFTYDALGNLSSYDDGTTSATYSYDAFGRKLTETVDYDSFTLSHSYEYYANGLTKSFTGPDGVKITYLYDENNRLSTIDIPNAGRVTYNTYHWNRPAKITLPGGSQIEMAYDPLMRLVSKEVKDPAQQFQMDYEYEYSPANNITKKTTEPGEYRYEYDELYRLTEATNPVLDDENYTYDALGNRLTATDVTGGGSYDANNALLTYGETAFEYDANGNLVKKTVGSQVTHYVYDADDRLVGVEDGDANIAKYYYDPFGRRLWKEVDGVRTYFVYADEGIIGEYDENGIEIKGYGYQPDSMWTTNPLFQKNNGSYYWYQNDHLGTPQKLVDNLGNVVWDVVYEAFGKAQVDVALVENNLRFPGQYFDAETGLHYNFFRDYDPNFGRYIESDPIGLGGGINTYVYASNNSVSFVDFLGLAYSPGEHGYNCRPSVMPWSDEWCEKLKNFIERQRQMLELYQEVAKGNPEAIKSLENDVEKLADPSMKGCFVNPKITGTPGGTEVCVTHECRHLFQFVDVIREMMKGGKIGDPAWQKKIALWEIEAYKVGIEEGEEIYNAHCGGCKLGERWK